MIRHNTHIDVSFDIPDCPFLLAYFFHTGRGLKRGRESERERARTRETQRHTHAHADRQTDEDAMAGNSKQQQQQQLSLSVYNSLRVMLKLTFLLNLNPKPYVVYFNFLTVAIEANVALICVKL